MVLVLVAVAASGAGCADAPPPASPAPAASGPVPCSPSVDLDGFSDTLETAAIDGRPVANLSALAARPDGTVLALSDRSVLFTLDAAAGRPLAARPLAGRDGGPLDSEALVVDTDRTLLVTSETGPSVGRHTPDGRWLEDLPVPAPLRVAPAGRATGNQTFEGLALQPDGRTLVASMEGPLAGDDPGLVRLATWTRERPGAPFVPSAQYALRPDPGLGVSDLVATGDGRLLVLERGFAPGAGSTVHLAVADPAGAPDVAGVDRLPADSPTVRTTTLANVGDCPSLGAITHQPQANPLLDNIEGMTITGRTPDGAWTLLLVSDDNENANQVTRTYRLTARLGPR
ncbi:phytase-like protein with esterase activity [Pseudonocardia endophytica]|uniref:Phytase-like protein with esterase activity n=2 Tax=Pseudonocardia endophytica TaxID=401976 RepID=A0A4V2PII8_PSEEN|nr:phytase-like protein with esterase activity [Pseudonocardia endophytica]